MISKQQVVHKIQLTISPSQVRIEIRFPCKLQIGVKVGKDQIHTNQEVQLNAGVATFSENIKTDTFIAYDRQVNRYLQKKATLTVYVVSPRGKNIAGVLMLDLSSIFNQPTQSQSLINQKLERCPDKGATINLKIKGNIIQELLDANLSLISERSSAFIQPVNRVLSIPNDRLQTEYRTNPVRLEGNLSDRRIDRNKSQSNRKSAVEELPISIQNRSDFGFKVDLKQDSLINNQNNKLKNRIYQLQKELESSNRELAQKRRLQNEIDSSSYKISQLQKVISGNRMQIDSTNREKKREGIQLSNRVEELQKLNLTLQKRVDIKSNFYKQELEKYNSKLLSAENQKQQFILEITHLKDENFDLNRKINALKDKEKILNDEKIKLNKRIQQFKKQPTQKQPNQEISSKDLMYDRLKQTISNRQIQKLSLMDELEKLKNQMLNQSIFRTKYEQELKEKNNLIQQKLHLENQNSLLTEEITTQISKQNKQLMEKSDQIHNLNSKIIQLTSKNKFQNSRMMEEIETLKATLQFVRQTQEKGRYEYEQISFALQQNQRQFNESIKKCLSLQSCLKQASNQNEQLRKNLKFSSDQLKKLNLQIVRMNSFVNSLQEQLAQQNDSKRKSQIQYKSTILKMQETNKQLQKSLQISTDQLSMLKMQIIQQEQQSSHQLQKKDRMMKQKQQQLRNILEEQTNLQIKNDQLGSSLNQLKQVIRTLQTELNTQKSNLENLKKINSILQISQSELKQALNQVKSLLTQKQNQYEILHQVNQKLDASFNQTKNQFQNYKETIGQHILTLLKCLVARNTTLEPIPVEGMPQGLIKLQSEVITKVKSSYQEVDVITQKLLQKEMEFINLEQNNSLQGNTSQIQINQLKKQLQSSKQQISNLNSVLETTRNNFATQNQNLNMQITQIQMVSSENLSSRLKEMSNRHQKQLQKIRDESLQERKQLQDRIQQLQEQLTNLQKQLYDQYNEVNLLSLKNFQDLQVIKQLQYKLTDKNGKQGTLQSQKGRLVEEVLYLQKQLQGLSIICENLKINLNITLERQAILVQQNEYIRSLFQAPKPTNNTNDQFEVREKQRIQMHKATSEINRLNGVVVELNSKLQQKQGAVHLLQQNVRHLGEEVEQKYRLIYQLENQMKQIKIRARDNSRSRANISKTEENNEDKIKMNIKINDLLSAMNEAIKTTPTQVSEHLLNFRRMVSELLGADDSNKGQKIGSNSRIL